MTSKLILSYKKIYQSYWYKDIEAHRAFCDFVISRNHFQSLHCAPLQWNFPILNSRSNISGEKKLRRREIMLIAGFNTCFWSGLRGSSLSAIIYSYIRRRKGEITRICAYTSWATLRLVSSKRSDCWSRHKTTAN